MTITLPGRASKLSEVFLVAPEHAAEFINRTVQDLLAVGDEEHPSRTDRTNVERGQDGLARSGCRDYKRSAVAGFAHSRDCRKCFSLHRVGHDFGDGELLNARDVGLSPVSRRVPIRCDRGREARRIVVDPLLRERSGSIDSVIQQVSELFR